MRVGLINHDLPASNCISSVVFHEKPLNVGTAWLTNKAWLTLIIRASINPKWLL